MNNPKVPEEMITLNKKIPVIRDENGVQCCSVGYTSDATYEKNPDGSWKRCNTEKYRQCHYLTYDDFYHHSFLCKDENIRVSSHVQNSVPVVVPHDQCPVRKQLAHLHELDQEFEKMLQDDYDDKKDSPKNEDPFIDKDPIRIINFSVSDGRYVSSDGEELTADFIMQHDHTILNASGHLVLKSNKDYDHE